MAGTERALCIAIHDVAPPTWQLCQKLIAAVAQVAPVPLTFLVVPAYHHHGECQGDADYFAALEQARSQGSELALHGYTHLDEGRRPDCTWNFFWRQVYTRGEGEFAALGVEQARQRLAWARECFARRGWQAQGFVAPAWLLSEGSWQALREAGFGYTTSFSRFYLLREGRSLFAPSLVYSSRNGWGSALSRSGTSVSAQLLRAAPLLRLALHPQDANHRSTLLHCQRLVEQLLQTRDAMTKMEFAQRWSARCHDDASPNRFRASDRPV